MTNWLKTGRVLPTHKGYVFPSRFRHTSYPHQRIDADYSISAPTPSILLVSQQITSEVLHVIRLKYLSLLSSITWSHARHRQKNAVEFLEYYDEDVIR